jgi:hypothetical protein
VTGEITSNGPTSLPARTYRYDVAGNLVWQQDRDGRVTGYTYVALNGKHYLNKPMA